MRRGGGSKGSLPVKDPDQAKSWVKYWTEMRGVPEGMFLLCEYLPGRDYAVQSLWLDGDLVQAKACERLHDLFLPVASFRMSRINPIGKRKVTSRLTIEDSSRGLL
jgi:carbamoyl-phosphate synthase large subunit